VELQEVIAHEHGLWAAAIYFKDWLASFEPKAPDGVKAEARFLNDALRHALAQGVPNAHTSHDVRQIVDQAVYQAQLHEPGCTSIKAFRQWLRETTDLAVQVHYTLAAIDYILDTYVWAITVEIQELRSLRKALVAGWAMLREAREEGSANDPDGNGDAETLENTVRNILKRCRNLLTTYGEI
jgi:hypothetical protein